MVLVDATHRAASHLHTTATIRLKCYSDASPVLESTT